MTVWSGVYWPSSRSPGHAVPLISLSLWRGRKKRKTDTNLCDSSLAFVGSSRFLHNSSTKRRERDLNKILVSFVQNFAGWWYDQRSEQTPEFERIFKLHPLHPRPGVVWRRTVGAREEAATATVEGSWFGERRHIQSCSCIAYKHPSTRKRMEKTVFPSSTVERQSQKAQ